MSINPLQPNAMNTVQQAAQTSAESREVGVDRDGDADDSATQKTPIPSAPATQPAPATTNLQGQTIGATLSTKA